MRRILRLIVVVLFVASVANAQTATVTRNVNVRPDASSALEPIRLLTPPTTLDLIPPVEEDNGYYHVRTAEGEEGWVWGRNIDIQGVAPEPDPTADVAEAGSPTLPACEVTENHHRWEMKTRGPPTDSPTPISMTVSGMLNWRVPDGLPSSARTSNHPIAPLEEYERVYELSAFVRHVKFQKDCDFHIELAGSQDQDAAQVIVEIPRTQAEAQRDLMRLLDMNNGQKSKTWSDPSDTERLVFVGYAFLDQTHQTNPPTQEGHGHGGKGGVVQTLWELHPVWDVREP
ncbi:MAG TPA: hypothetical protein DCP38_16370 [Acidobacteria bacterium]|jgi:hypothetical protein|nr:SH3 domain-containing protein [SAR202 cluster bacterium]HAK57034.1 hypothetical protein [Acidobacteriota bacterium]|tara:strand:- start:997 stop:1854 length:858 start_codon:yes stop_codon:yes gene_type:complete